MRITSLAFSENTPNVLWVAVQNAGLFRIQIQVLEGDEKPIIFEINQYTPESHGLASSNINVIRADQTNPLIYGWVRTMLGWIISILLLEIC